MSLRHWNKLWEQEKIDFEKLPPIETSYIYNIFRVHFKGRKINKIVEIGAGTGLTCLRLAKKFAAVPYLVDLSPKALELEKRNSQLLGISAVIKKGDIRNIPFPDNYFDCTFSIGVNEHFEGGERKKTFSEMIRITRKKSVILVTTPYAYCIFYRIGKFIRDLLRRWPFGFEKPYSEIELKKIMCELKIPEENYEIIKTGKFIRSFRFLLFGKFSRKFYYLTAKMSLPLFDKLFGDEITIIIRK
jgi:ubiquinone/menaquinone biosynthesis C-methylase UbiE